MYYKVEQTYYTLSAVALFGVMFVFSPSTSVEVKDFQTQIIAQVRVAFNQTISDVDLVEPLDLVWSGIDSFYLAGSQQALAIIPAVEIPDSVHLAFQQVSDKSIKFLASNFEKVLPQPIPAVEYPQELAQAPVYNIVPPFTDSRQEAYNGYVREEISTNVVPSQELATEDTVSSSASVLGITTDEQPLNSISTPWVTLEDNITGQKYCVAIYNSEVNKYLGECKHDYY